MPTPKDVIRRIVEEIFNQDNFDAINDLYAADYTDHSALPGQPAGRDTVRATAIRYREAFPDLHWQIEDLIAEEDDAGIATAALRWTAIGTHEGEYAGIPATGRRITFTGISFYRLRSGQVTDEWVSWDEAGILAQLTRP
jgi:steroid delta-isomerase-like uncharacterized protein